MYERDPINEYNNPDLFPGMFPTLFPLGIGGFEDHHQSHVEHLLDQSSREFRYHHFFSFRRKAHLHTSLSISSKNFDMVAPAFSTVTANKLKNEKDKSDFTDDEQHAFQLLNQVNVISAKIPGSQASRTTTRNQIRSYYAYFVHSPIFQVMYGQTDIDLAERFPHVVHPRSERACRVARDPVAAADFFDFMYHTIFQQLLGWDFKLGKSTENGGIFGHLQIKWIRWIL
ncbi:hypothetical protein F5877DRAFT_91625 [Lentinula edodes]|nr:hypothetical protein F5877DRAFT_91625 [Lentinula edodes]